MTPTRSEIEPRRCRGRQVFPKPISSTPVYSKDLRKIDPLSPRPRPRKEGGVFNRLGRKEPATSARSDSHRRKKVRDSEGCHWKSKSKMPEIVQMWTIQSPSLLDMRGTETFNLGIRAF
ncbi:hypothetical protein Tco_0064073 [Tanacetum coccineum]